MLQHPAYKNNYYDILRKGGGIAKRIYLFHLTDLNIYFTPLTESHSE